jgi:hypothetical protein
LSCEARVDGIQALDECQAFDSRRLRFKPFSLAGRGKVIHEASIIALQSGKKVLNRQQPSRLHRFKNVIAPLSGASRCWRSNQNAGKKKEGEENRSA